MKRLLVAVLASGCARDWVVWRDVDARIVEHGATQRVVVSKRSGEPHAAIGVGSVSVRAGHVAYAARDGLAWRVYRDGIAQPGAWQGVGAVGLSQDGSLAYTAERDGRWWVVTPRETRSWRAVRDVRFAPVLAYVATDEEGEHAVIGESISPAFHDVIALEADGFLARPASNGPRVAYVRGARVAEGEIDRLLTRGGHYAFVRADASGEVAVRDGRDRLRCASIDSMTLSKDGEHLGIACARSSGVDLVVDGARVGTFVWARAPVFGAAGGYAWVASLGAGAFVRTSAAPDVSHTFDVVVEDTLVVDDDARHWAVVAGYASVRKLYVVVDGKPVGPFSAGDPDASVERRLRVAMERARSSP